MPESGASPTPTIRSLWLNVKARHVVNHPEWYTDSTPLCEGCGEYWPCPDHADAVAALDLLDKSEVEKWWDETEHNYANPIFYRLVPDSEGDAS